MSMLCKEKSYKFSKILKKIFGKHFLSPCKKGLSYYIEAFWTARNNLGKNRENI